MPQRWDAEDTAESIIEIMTIYHEIGFSSDISASNLTNMAFLDPVALESGEHRACFGLDVDWNSALISVEKDASRRAAIRLLGKAVLERNDSVLGYVKDLEAYLTTEFNPSPQVTQEIWQRRNLYEKVFDLATRRIQPLVFYVLLTH